MNGPDEELLGRVGELRRLVDAGRGAAVLPALSALLVDIRLRASGSAPGSIEFEWLCDLMILALDTGRRAHAALGQWAECIECIDEMEALERAKGSDEQTILDTNFNRYAPLLGLRRIPEAQNLLELCVDTYRAHGDTVGEAKSLSALAIVADLMGDQAHAVELESEALGIFRETDHYVDLSASHANLSRYLHRVGRIDEVGDHWLAAFVVRLLIGGDATTLLQLLSWHFHFTGIRGGELLIPSLPALSQKSEFAEIARLLMQANVSVSELQDRIAETVYEVREQVLSADAPRLALSDEAECPCGSGKLFLRCHGEDAGGAESDAVVEQNDQMGCPCGSGRAFEDCHGNPAPIEITEDEKVPAAPKVIYIDMVLEKE